MRAMGMQSDTSLSSTLLCPKCRQKFETVRRFWMACPECGYEWEEESHRTTADTISEARSEVVGYVFMAVGWDMLLAFIGAVMAIFVIGAIRATERGGLANGLVVVGIFVLLIVGIAVHTRRSMEIAEKNVWWVPRWRNRD
jgi:hypothetical protein